MLTMKTTSQVMQVMRTRRDELKAVLAELEHKQDELELLRLQRWEVLLNQLK